MNNDKMIQFVKRWRELDRQQRDLDFRKSEWCRDVRGEFPTGDLGDQQFANWCDVEIGLTPGQAKELLLRAQAVTVVPDPKTWNTVGGFRAIQKLEGLSKRDQVNVLEASKSTGKAIQTIIRERGLGPRLPPIVKPAAHTPARHTSPTAPANANTPSRLEIEHDEVLEDAITLVRYIAKTGKDIPRNILALIAKYGGGNIRAGAYVRKKAG